MAEDMLPDNLLTHVASFVAGDGANEPAHVFERFNAMLLTSKRFSRATKVACRRALARVLRRVMPPIVSTQRLIEVMNKDSELFECVVQTKSSSPAILSRLVDLSNAAAIESTHLAAAALIESAREPLRASLKRATVGPMYDDPARATVGPIRPMYDDPAKLADDVIARLKRGPAPYEPITEDLATKARAFFRDAATAHSKCKYGPLCLWDVSAVSDFSNVFACAHKNPEEWSGNLDGGVPPFNSDLYWNTSSATTMGSMFRRNTEFKGNLSVWDVKKVRMMSGMFEESGIDDSGIRHWNTASLEFAAGMFQGAKQLSNKLDLSKWTTCKCRGMQHMFSDSALVDGGIGNWDVTPGASTYKMLSGTKFIGDLGRWPTDERTQALLGVMGHGSFGTSSRQPRIAARRKTRLTRMHDYV